MIKETMKACIILPTYNERQNIGPLLNKLMQYPIDVLVVDDQSPDGTAAIVQAHAQFNKRIFLLSGKKKGLGKAYQRGFQWALQHAYDVVFEMDADFSHDPQAIPAFLAAIKKNDFVIGSRYISKGKIIGWPWKRKLISKTANGLVRIFLGIYAKDATSGFRAIKTTLLKKLMEKNLSTKGYGIQIELLYYAQQQKAKIKEIPITFRERKKGKSKLSKKDILEFLLIIIKLMKKRWFKMR